MAIAAEVGPERLREIMAGLVARAEAVVIRHGGTVDKFTGDGIMALFGAPIALEDHALRACRSALEIHYCIDDLVKEVAHRDGITLQLRIGLNSGEVIAGSIGSAAAAYTAVGEQVGMAQRMESVAPPNGVMLSPSTTRLVQGVAVLGQPQQVHIKGADQPLTACQLISVPERTQPTPRRESVLVGRRSELASIESLLCNAATGGTALVRLMGPPGIGKSRMVRELAAIARRRGADTFTVFCESHTNRIPFSLLARLLRAAFGIEDLAPQEARRRVRSLLPFADSEDLRLLDDLLGIRDPDQDPPEIDPDARRRRLIALVVGAATARGKPAAYFVEDVHWIDDVSESMLTEIATALAETDSLLVLSYRPEYQGELARVPAARTIVLEPLGVSDTSTLVSELTGPDSSVADLIGAITERAAGIPYFAEEIVRDLAERGLLDGQPGAYTATAKLDQIGVPATLQTTIAARIDRLQAAAKRTLRAASVLGSRFSADVLRAVGIEPCVDDLVAGQFVDPIGTATGEFAFHHPLIRSVAYDTQLRSDRADLHRRVAAAIEAEDSPTTDHAALIAEHLEAAGDLRRAFDWHMRAGERLSNRDLGAARQSWQRAKGIADRLDGAPDQLQIRIAPRTVLCATAWRVGGPPSDTGIDELRELTSASGDRRPLAVATSGLLLTLAFNGHLREAAQLGVEHAELLEFIGDPAMTVGLLFGSTAANWESGNATVASRLAQRVIDLAGGNPTMGNIIIGSPLALALSMRGLANSCLGLQGWKRDLTEAVEIASGSDHFTHVLTTMFSVLPMGYGALMPDTVSAQHTVELVDLAMRSGDDFTLANARMAHGALLVLQDGEDRDRGFELLGAVRQSALQQRFTLAGMWFHDILKAQDLGRSGNLDAAIDLARTTTNNLIDAGCILWSGMAISTLVELLLERAGPDDLHEAQASTALLANPPNDARFTLYELPLLRLRALLAQTLELRADYQTNRDRYRRSAASCGFEGHIKWAEEMP